jgi:predicted MPP superfamily phosphohydrolase
MSRIVILCAVLLVYFLIEYYVFQVVQLLTEKSASWTTRLIWSSYWLWVVLMIGGFTLYTQLDTKVYASLRVLISALFFINLICKLFVSLVLLGDDLRRLVSYISQFVISKEAPRISGRTAFIGKVALLTGVLPMMGLSFGILSGAHDYRIRRRDIYSPRLPKSFDGIRLVQISDIHTGSFFNKIAVKGGVDIINQEKGDIVLFTGDFVNNQSDEAKPYLDLFAKVKAPLGVHAVMGNHDYGDYHRWDSMREKKQNIKNLHQMHRYMGWNIMLNENKIITTDGESIALLGLENWGAGRFSKYGDMSKTYMGTEEIPYKILMSHDPSHWDAQVLSEYPDIDLMLAGHTHGMQFGVEIGDFRWSPSQYVYKQWADLYQKGTQSLYVNRGFGFLGYPGRIGILPEITVLTLKRSTS